MRLHLDAATPKTGDTGQATSVHTGVSTTGATDRSGGVSADSVTISGPSSALNRLSQERAARVSELAAAVRAGSYQLSSSAISGAIVQSAIR